MAGQTHLRQAIASLGVTAALLVSGAALCAPANAAAAGPSAVRPSAVAASLQASAVAGSMWSGRRTVISPRVLPVLTKRPRATTTVAPTVTEAQAYVNELVRLTNAERAALGLPALRVDACATRYAVAHNAVITRNAALSHQDLGLVLSGCTARGAGENVAFTYGTAARMTQMWMGSPAHRANLLNDTFTHIGIAAGMTPDGRWYGTQVFLRRYV